MSATELYTPVIPLELTIKEISGLISLPEIYLKFRQLQENPNASLDDFSNLVSCDPNLSTRVLRLVNSAFFGFPGQIESINRAIAMLGIGQLHDMVLATSAVASLRVPNDIMPLITFWRSSLFTGVLTRLLAKHLKIRHHETLFVIGLLHEIGHLVIYAKYPEQAQLAIKNSSESNQRLCHSEEAILGLHYGQVGAKLMAQWQLPLNFQEITQFQPTPNHARTHPLETALIHIAHGYAHQIFADKTETLDQLISPDAWNVSELSPIDIESALENALQVCDDLEKTILR